MTRTITFQVRPWDVGLYVGMKEYLETNLSTPVRFDFLTHNFEVEADLRSRGLDCINVVRETRGVALPNNWRDELRALEERCFGATRNFAQYVCAERYLVGLSGLEKITFLYRMATFYARYFEQARTLLFLTNGPDHLANWLPMDMVRAFGGHACGFVPPSWPRYRFSLYREVGRIYWAPEKYERYLEEGLTDSERHRALELQRDFMEGRAIPINVCDERHEMTTSTPLLQRGRNWMRGVYWQTVERREGSWYLMRYPIPGRAILANLAASFQVSRRRRWFSAGKLPPGPFAFFPLHLEPESTTNVYSNFYDNQLEVIRAISKALPIDWKLVVKEHPNMRQRRPRGFYQTIHLLPNTVLLDGSIPGGEVVKKSDLVLTLSGTAGLEASLIGKPVVVFGDAAWGYAASVQKVGPLHDLPGTIRSALSRAVDPQSNEVLSFILSWDEANPEGIHDYFPWLPAVDSPDNIARLSAAVTRLIGELSTDGNS